MLTISADPPLTEAAEELLGLVALHVAARLKQFELSDRLAAEDPGHRLFDALAAGNKATAATLAREIGCDPRRWHVVVHVESLGFEGGVAIISDSLEARLGRSPVVVVDRCKRVRALAALPVLDDADDGLAELASAVDAVARSERIVVGLSEPRMGAGECGPGLREAKDAARIARDLLADGGALAYRALGAYKYLSASAAEDPPTDDYARAVEELVAYDREHLTSLLETLEAYLRDRHRPRNASLALNIHPNTLRQRLERVESLTGLRLAQEDLLSLELAVKVGRVRASGMRGARRVLPSPSSPGVE